MNVLWSNEANWEGYQSGLSKSLENWVMGNTQAFQGKVKANNDQMESSA